MKYVYNCSKLKNFELINEINNAAERVVQKFLNINLENLNISD